MYSGVAGVGTDPCANDTLYWPSTMPATMPVSSSCTMAAKCQSPCAAVA